MTTPTTTKPAEELDELIRHTPGVDTLYRSDSLLGHAITTSRQLLSTENETEPYVRLTETNGTTTVTVTIGINSNSAIDASRAVHDTITTWMHKHGHPNTTITVTIANVTA